MLDKITIKEASMEEKEMVLSLWLAFMKHLSQVEPENFCLKEDYRLEYQKMLPALLKDEKTLVLIAWAGDEAIGYHVTSIRYPLPILQQKPFGQVSDHFVKEGFRGLGVGTSFLKESRYWLQKHNIQEMHLKTFLHNKEGLEFWKKQGFSPVEVRLKKTL